ncbi:MAG: hypothetical protein IH794_06145, partial [Acidobacteria bacterium]|nr:hypothetical protein [Acidobacteriota bacterium]
MFGLSASFHKYGDVCGERDGVEFAKRRRRDVCGIAEEERQRNRCRPAATLRADGGCGRSRGTRLRVTRRRRCPCIASSSLLDLPSQAPSANIIVFMERDTKVVIGVTDPMKWVIHDRGKPTGGEILIRSSMKSVHRSILFSNLPEVERRAVTRLGLPLTGKVTFEIQGKEVEKAVKTKDISAAGGYFISETSPAIGDQVKLLLQW